MKRFYFFLVVIALLSACTTPKYLPREYSKEYREKVKETKSIRKTERPDVIIPPIEQVPVNGLWVQAGENWAYDYLNVPAAIKKTDFSKARKVIVFIFDTGGEYEHEALKKATRRDLQKSFTDEGSGKDGNGHSTHVAGIIAGVTPGKDIGICAELVNRNLLHVVPIKVLHNDGYGYYSWIANGINYANSLVDKLQKEGYFVVYNFSLGGGGKDETVSMALAAAVNKGVLVFAAAGNTGSEGINYPGSDISSNSVAALSLTNGKVERATYSTYGNGLFASAPGTSIYSTFVPGNEYAALSGTSMATPTMAAQAAWVAATTDATVNASQVLAILQVNSTDLQPDGWDKYTGYGFQYTDRIVNGGDDTDPCPKCPNDPDPTPDPGKHELRGVWVSVHNPGSVQWQYNGEQQMYTVKIDKIEVFVQGEQQEPIFTKLADGIIKDFVQRNVIVVERGKHDEIDVARYVLTFLDFSFRDKGYTIHEAGEIWTTTKQAVSVRIVANEYSRAIDSASSSNVRCFTVQRIGGK